MNLSIPISEGISGNRTVPGDKSITHRALMIASIADGISEIKEYSKAEDPLSTLSCIKQLGVIVEVKKDVLRIHGNGRHGLKKANSNLNAGNSGTTMRLLSGILCGQKFSSTIIGDESLSKRPMKRIIEPLQMMGADISGSDTHTAPIKIKSVDKLNPINYKLPIPSAQVKSALIFAAIYTDGLTIISESFLTRDHTERMLGLNTKKENNLFSVSVNSDIKIEGKNIFVPGDISAAAFLISAGLLVKGSDIVIKNVGLNPTRTRILDIFKLIGGNISIENMQVVEGEPIGDIRVKSSELNGNINLSTADVVELIDEIPIIAVTGLFTNGTICVRNAKELRAKETDRIKAIVNNLRSLGTQIEEYEDGFSFEGNKSYKGAALNSFNDHRIAMAFGVAGLRIPNIEIINAECVDISFPNYWKELLSNSR